MIFLLKSEYQKTRKCYLFLMALAITAIQLGWTLQGKYKDPFLLENGWMMFLYQLPLINTIFLPLLSLIISSRLCDIEYKGNAFKQLAVLTEKGKLYDAKLIYGLITITTCILINWFAIVIFGHIKCFGEPFPLKWYLLYLLFTIVPTAAIYVFQHTLAMLFKNQAVPFFAGIIGTFLGLFSMFLSSWPILRKSLLWGYYGVLQFVGLFGWTKEYRYEKAWISVMEIDWMSFCILILMSILIYFIGRYLFCQKEV